MVYKFATEKLNYEDYSSGRVLYNQKGTTSFPARLGSEIFQRCVDFLRTYGEINKVNIYDPCCGGAYLLTTLGFLHGESISKIFASDISEEAIELARKNISLLTVTGMDMRINQLSELKVLYEKDSHFGALKSAEKLRDSIKGRDSEFEAFCLDITKPNQNFEKVKNIHVLISDIPYGDIVVWNEEQSDDEAISKLLTNVYPLLADVSIVALISKKKIKIRHQNFIKVETISAGKRLVTLLRPNK